MKLEDIGFYTLSDQRARTASPRSPMQRTEIILTDRCNFACIYCRGLRTELAGDLPLDEVKRLLDLWAMDGLVNVRFSGGEPTLYRNLEGLVRYCKLVGVRRVAISTNGSAELEVYERLISAGVDDISISLDACCAGDFELMAGGIKGYEQVTRNLAELASQVYVTVGIVLTKDNVGALRDTIVYADSLGVADIRIIPAAQWNILLDGAMEIPPAVLIRHPILAYRVHNIAIGRAARGLRASDSRRCWLVVDDSAVAGKWHFPCIIYLREGGSAIGEVSPDMRRERAAWAVSHDSWGDPICRANCLDVCIDYNNRCRDFGVVLEGQHAHQKQERQV